MHYVLYSRSISDNLKIKQEAFRVAARAQNCTYVHSILELSLYHRLRKAYQSRMALFSVVDCRSYRIGPVVSPRSLSLRVRGDNVRLTSEGTYDDAIGWNVCTAEVLRLRRLSKFKLRLNDTCMARAEDFFELSQATLTRKRLDPNVNCLHLKILSKLGYLRSGTSTIINSRAHYSLSAV